MHAESVIPLLPLPRDCGLTGCIVTKIAITGCMWGEERMGGRYTSTTARASRSEASRRMATNGLTSI